MATRRTKANKKGDKESQDQEPPAPCPPKDKKQTTEQQFIRRPLAKIETHNTAQGEVIKEVTSRGTSTGSLICRGLPQTQGFTAIITSGESQTEVLIENEIFQELILVELDLQDREDPFYCTDYVNDIHTHMLESEKRDVYTISENFLSNQSIITSEQRSILVDWLIQVQVKFKLLQETLYIAIDILDRYLDITDVPKEQLQLTGVTSLLVASKYEEIYPPGVSDYTYICANTYSVNEVLEKERTILRSLQYEINKPYPLQFLRRYSKITNATRKEHGLAKYLLEQGLLDWRLSMEKPSIKAIAALLLAKTIIQCKPVLDCVVLFKYTGYTLDDVKIIMYRLKTCLFFYKSHKLSAVRTKYESEKYLKIAKAPELEKHAITMTTTSAGTLDSGNGEKGEKRSREK